MEVLDLTVPKNKNILDFLAEMGEKTKNAWIFLHESIISDVTREEGTDYAHHERGLRYFFWTSKAREHAHSRMICSVSQNREWYMVGEIMAPGVAFEKCCKNRKPDYIILLQKEGA